MTEIHDLTVRINDVINKLDRISEKQILDHAMIADHDKILIRGTDTRPSLQEIVRTMSDKQDAFILAFKEEEERKKLEWNKWKWVLIATGIAIVPKVASDVINFYVTFVSSRITP